MYSVIMPTFNCCKYAISAVKSVLKQTYTDFELIVIDDGSTDGTFELLKEFCLQDNRVKLFQNSHAGVSAARNFGIKKAQGEYVLFIDGDDAWKEDLLELCSKEDNNGMVLFGIQQDYYDCSETLAYSKASMDPNSQIRKIDSIKDIDFLISKYNMASPCNKVYKKEILDQFDVRFSTNCVYLEDLKFNLDYLCHIATINIINKDLYLYRLYTGNKQILKRKFGKFLVNTDEIVQSAKKLRTTLGINSTKTPILNSLLLRTYYHEFCGVVYGKDYAYSKKMLKELNANPSYKELLVQSKGKFFTILKLLRKFKCYKLQLKVIRRRYF